MVGVVMWLEAAPWLVSFAIAFAAWSVVYRHGGGAALAELERANRILERRVRELENENTGQASELANLRARTDVATALEPVGALLATQHGDAMRHFAQLETLLATIADRLGSDADHG